MAVSLCTHLTRKWLYVVTVRIDMVATVMYMTSQTINHKDTRLLRLDIWLLRITGKQTPHIPEMYHMGDHCCRT